jgi:hypothetical protein
MSILSITQTIAVGRVATYLAVSENSDGVIYNPKLVSNTPAQILAMVTDALDWGFTGAAQSDTSLRCVAEYLLWLCGGLGQTAQVVLGQDSGGTVVPSGNNNGFPYTITAADFEPDGITYNSARIAGVNISLFIDQFNSNWLYAPTYFDYTSTGIVLVGINANDVGVIQIQKLYN